MKLSKPSICIDRQHHLPDRIGGGKLSNSTWGGAGGVEQVSSRQCCCVVLSFRRIVASMLSTVSSLRKMLGRDSSESGSGGDASACFAGKLTSLVVGIGGSVDDLR